MTDDTTPDTPSPHGGGDDIAGLRAELRALALRIEALENRSAASAPGGPDLTDHLAAAATTARTRAGAAWAALRGQPPAPSAAPGVASGPDGAGHPAGAPAARRQRSALATVSLILLGLLAALVAIELIEEIWHGLRHVLRWIF